MADKVEKVHKRLSLAELKNCKGFESYSEQQAEETIKSLEKLSVLFYELYMKQKQTVQKIKENKKEEIYERKSGTKKRNAA
jgi:hypothetical protein